MTDEQQAVLIPAIRALTYTNLTQRRIMLRYNLRYQAFSDLTAIIEAWLNSSTGLTRSALIRANIAYHYSSCSALHYRLNAMIEKGLIYRVNNRYYPTDKALSELSNLFSEKTA